MNQCCDDHGRNCEPPSELCCANCTEAAHRMGDAVRGFHLSNGSPCNTPDLSAMVGPNLTPSQRRREQERERRDAEAKQRADLDRELDRAAELAHYYPAPLGAALADLLAAGRPFVAEDGHLSIAPIFRHSDEMMALARAVTATVRASIEEDNAERAADHCRREGRG